LTGAGSAGAGCPRSRRQRFPSGNTRPLTSAFSTFSTSLDLMFIFETERMGLRHLVPEDAHNLYAILGDPVAMKYYPAPKTLDETRQWIDNNIRRYAEDGYGLWAMIRKQDGAFLGNCGPVLRTVDGAQEVEIGYQVLRKYQRKGYATEA